MSSGTGGQIALTRSDSLYLSVESVDQWTNFVSESVEHTLNELEEGSITGNKDAPPSHKGIDFGQGDLVIEPDPVALGNFMRGVYGQSSGSILTEAGSTGVNSQALGAGNPVIQHQFLPIQAAYDENTFQAGALAQATFSVMSRKVERFARTAAIEALAKQSGSKPWVWDMASVEVSSGVQGFSSMFANTNFESITMNLNVPLEGVVLLDGNKNYAEFQVNEFRRMNTSGTISFRNQDEYDAFVEYENRSLRLSLSNTGSSQLLGNPDSAFYPSLQLDVPQHKFLTWSTPIGGPNRLQTSFTGKGERDTTSSYMTEAYLTNVKSAY
jgi:hypothetical protein